MFKVASSFSSQKSKYDVYLLAASLLSFGDTVPAEKCHAVMNYLQRERVMQGCGSKHAPGMQ